MKKLACMIPSFSLGDRVHIDADPSVIGMVTAIMWRGAGIQAEVCWFSSGVQQAQWIDDWRLEVIEA